MDAVIGTLKDALGNVLDEARKVPPVPNNNTQHIVLHQAETAKPEPKMAWLCATAAIIAALVAMGSMAFAMDARNEMRANDVKRQDDIRELRQADNAFRAYITTGRVPVQSQRK
jgi:hypothetical protein